MCCGQPGEDTVAQARRENPQFGHLGFRCGTGSIVVRGIPLLPKRVEASDFDRGGTNRQSQRLNDSVVGLISRGTIPRRRQGNGSRLECRVVRHAQPSVSADFIDRAVSQVPVDHAQEVAHFACARLVDRQPTVALPIWQAHAHLQ